MKQRGFSNGSDSRTLLEVVTRLRQDSETLNSFLRSDEQQSLKGHCYTLAYSPVTTTSPLTQYFKCFIAPFWLGGSTDTKRNYTTEHNKFSRSVTHICFIFVL